MGTVIIGNFVKEHYTKALTAIILTALFITVLDSDIRQDIKHFIQPDYRVILAVAVADIEAPGSHNQILKVKTNEGLFIEVYAERSAQNMPAHQELLASTKLPDKKDGYFTFNGEVTNLAVDDLHNDKKLEILATSFDNDLVAHLNVYQYIPGEKELQIVHLK